MQDLFGEIPQRTIPMMPDEYKGNEGKGCGYTKSKPREWTDQEIEWIQKMRADGFSNEEIGQSTASHSPSASSSRSPAIPTAHRPSYNSPQPTGSFSIIIIRLIRLIMPISPIQDYHHRAGCCGAEKSHIRHPTRRPPVYHKPVRV